MCTVARFSGTVRWFEAAYAFKVGLLLFIGLSGGSLGQGVPEPGLVLYGTVTSGQTGALISGGQLVWTNTTSSDLAVIEAKWITVEGQPAYLAIIPFETRDIVGLDTPLPASSNTLELCSPPVLILRSVGLEGAPLTLVPPALATYTFTLTDRGRIERVDLVLPSVVGRMVFYNHSAWDGVDPAAKADDDGAIAPDKRALLPGGTASFANYTSYGRGLNGIMVDVAGLRGTPTLADFTFRMGNDENPDLWSAAPAPVSVTVRPGAGVNGSDRLTLVWPDGTIRKQWLEVTVLATANTGLAQPDVFYFGNAVGETGNSATDAFVDGTDASATRAHARGFANPASLDDPYDFNRDKFVNGTDTSLLRANPTGFSNALRLIDLTGRRPAEQSSPPAEIVAGDAPANAGASGANPAVDPGRLRIERDERGAVTIEFLQATEGRCWLETCGTVWSGHWAASGITPEPRAGQPGMRWVVPEGLNETQRYYRVVITK